MSRIPMSLPILVLALGAACQPHATQVRGPDGREDWYTIDCRSPSTCYAKAGEVCPEGYTIADREGHTEATYIKHGDQTYGTQKFSGSMLVKCGAPPIPTPQPEPVADLLWSCFSSPTGFSACEDSPKKCAESRASMLASVPAKYSMCKPANAAWCIDVVYANATAGTTCAATKASCEGLAEATIARAEVTDVSACEKR